MRRVFLAAAAALVLAPAGASPAATLAVKITATAFSPSNVTVNFGDTVTWTNGDKADHQVVADNGSFASPTLKPNATWSYTFKAAGTYAYHDSLRPASKGSVKVNAPPSSVTLGVGSPTLLYGQQTTLTGTVSTGAANEPVAITGSAYGIAVKQVATVSTGAGGGFAYTIQPTILTTYVATWKTATSQTVTIEVRPKVTFQPFGPRFFTKVASSLSYAGRYAYLQRRSAFGQWVTIGKLKLGPNSGRIFSLPAFHGTATYHVYLPQDQAGPGYLDAWSGTQRVHRR